MNDSDAPGFAMDYAGAPELRDPIARVLKTVYDPEIPVDILELGLIYRVEVDEAGSARVKMTLTSPACPSAEQLPVEVREKVGAVEGIREAHVDVVWDPPWNPDFMSEAAKLQLGMY
jgi:FeS assembly SUF system protein